MAFLVRKLDDLVFNAGAVARANPFDMTTVHRREVEVITNHLVSGVVGVSQPAGQQVVSFARRTEVRKCQRLSIRGLQFSLAEINAVFVNPRWSAGLQAL